MIKPCLWPQIEFFSSRGQETQRLSWFSNNLSTAYRKNYKCEYILISTCTYISLSLSVERQLSRNEHSWCPEFWVSNIGTQLNSIQFSISVVSDSLWPHGLQHARLSCPSPTIGTYSNSCLSSSVMPSNHLILCCSCLLLPSSLRIRWPKYWSFRFSISLSHEYSRLISFRMNCFDPLAVQGTLKSLLQYHSSKASILWHSAFFIV